MPLLIITTLLWALSFSFVAVYLSGQVDNWFAVLMRAGLAFLVFLPFLRWRNVSFKQASLFMLVGALQLGVMYLFYYPTFLYLSVTEILLFTIVTPIYVTLIYDLLQGKKLRVSYLLCAVLSVIGAGVIRYNPLNTDFLLGFMLIQCANVCFALGQVGYKYLMELYPMPQRNAFSWFYAGALIITAIAWLLFGDANKLPTTTTQWIILFWLGIGASGLGFFMWNYGATQVDSGTLAIMNNALIPAGILVNVLIWQQPINWQRFSLGAAIIIFAFCLHRYWMTKTIKNLRHT